jgi:hypothetical protein
VIERFVTMHYGRELSHVCGYMRERDLMFYGKEILHFYLTIAATPILVDHETSCVGNTISLSFHAYKEHPYQRMYASCALI